MLSTSRHALCIYSRLCLRVKVAHSLSVSASNLLVSHCSVTVARSLLACRASRWLGVRLPRDEDQRRWVPGGCSQAPPTLRLPAHRQGPAAVWHAGTCKLVCWLMCSLTPRLTCCLGVSQHMPAHTRTVCVCAYSRTSVGTQLMRSASCEALGRARLNRFLVFTGRRSVHLHAAVHSSACDCLCAFSGFLQFSFSSVINRDSRADFCKFCIMHWNVFCKLSTRTSQTRAPQFLMVARVKIKISVWVFLCFQQPEDGGEIANMQDNQNAFFSRRDVLWHSTLPLAALLSFEFWQMDASDLSWHWTRAGHSWSATG